MTGFERNPWAITEQDFPVAGSVEEQLRFLLGYAILAPSSHNISSRGSFASTPRAPKRLRSTCSPIAPAGWAWSIPRNRN